MQEEITAKTHGDLLQVYRFVYVVDFTSVYKKTFQSVRPNYTMDARSEKTTPVRFLRRSFFRHLY